MTCLYQIGSATPVSAAIGNTVGGLTRPVGHHPLPFHKETMHVHRSLLCGPEVVTVSSAENSLPPLLYYLFVIVPIILSPVTGGLAFAAGFGNLGGCLFFAFSSACQGERAVPPESAEDDPAAGLGSSCKQTHKYDFQHSDSYTRLSQKYHSLH